MVEYFKRRGTPLARAGLSALQQSMAGIYCLPYICGIMLHFRFSGQSIPNRCGESPPTAVLSGSFYGNVCFFKSIDRTL
jgi:hypothetical protein